MRLLLRWLINMVALYLAVQLLPGIHFEGGVVKLALVAALFGLVNTLLRPLLTVLTCPLVVLTLGLFTIVINGLLLLATSALSVRWHLGFRVDGIWPAILGGLVIGVVSVVLAILLGDERRPKRTSSRL